MKIKTLEKTYEEVLALPVKKRKKPVRPGMLFRILLRVLSAPELKKVNFEVNKIGMDKLAKNEPCLVLMNHSSFIDLKIASTVLYPRPFNIVCTSDGFVGKEWLMRRLGCIPTQKFVPDIALVQDMLYCVKTLKSSVLMYPESSYSFDGTATPLPESLGKCLKVLKVPVVMIRTYGAFARDPLYNGLRLRNVKVSVDMEYLLSPETIEEKKSEELNEILAKRFSFDNFRWQQENGVRITEEFRAEGLNRVLYKCPVCETEGMMQGSGTEIVCKKCGKAYVLTETGSLAAKEGETRFSHIPDWYKWERECVKQELLQDTYHLEVPVNIMMMVDTSGVYKVGQGILRHNKNGFFLNGCEGKLNYEQKPLASYSLYSDYFWYEIGDMICIGDNKVLYYCFPQGGGDVVAKTRLAAEELYKLVKSSRRGRREKNYGIRYANADRA